MDGWEKVRIAASLVGALGGLAGFTSLIIELLRRSQYEYLQVRLTPTVEGSRITVLTLVSNRSSTPQTIENALLLLSQEGVAPDLAANRLATTLVPPRTINDVDEIHKWKLNSPVYHMNKTEAIIPLPFYYEENEEVVDEELSYRCTIDTNNLKSGTYAVRLYVSGGSFYRLTQELVILP